MYDMILRAILTPIEYSLLIVVGLWTYSMFSHISGYHLQLRNTYSPLAKRRRGTGFTFLLKSEHGPVAERACKRTCSDHRPTADEQSLRGHEAILLPRLHWQKQDNIRRQARAVQIGRTYSRQARELLVTPLHRCRTGACPCSLPTQPWFCRK